MPDGANLRSLLLQRPTREATGVVIGNSHYEYRARGTAVFRRDAADRDFSVGFFCRMRMVSPSTT